VSHKFRPSGASALSIFLALVLTTVAAQEKPSSGKFDGPAELPRVSVKSSVADTPAPGKVRMVKGSDNLQEALNSAKCGDTLKLEAGATFDGNFRIPNKPCDDSHWIIIRTSASDDSLPPEGTRMTPCYAGVASLPGRPEYRCDKPRNVLAKIAFGGNGDSGPLILIGGANHYRFVGLEITRGKKEGHMRNLVQPGKDKEKDKDDNDKAEPVHHIVFDRLWLHGTANDETKAGIHLSGTNHIAVVDSYLNDFHCIARKGSCTDAQAVNGGGGAIAGGPYKIENNFLEASGQSILFGGAPATATPTDIEIRRNHMFKPLTWKPGESNFVGSPAGEPFIAKNNFELKNAQRVLLEGNIFENSWGGFSQAGFSILLTPKNQAPGVCPICKVTDVTIRYSRVIRVAGVLQIANALGGHADENLVSAGGGRYSIHDLVAEEIHQQDFKGPGSFAMLGSRIPPLHDVWITNCTAFPPGVLISIFNPASGPKMSGIKIENNIFGASQRQIASTGGGASNCAFQFAKAGPDGVLKNCLADDSFTGNLIVGGKGAWPASTITVKDEAAAALRNVSKADFRPCRQGDSGCGKPSPALKAGRNGRDIGADMDAIEKATAGVR
jgi:hypothetical protein